jgi:hypothetical protein
VRLRNICFGVIITIHQAGSAVALTQQEKNDSVDVQRNRIHITGFM